MRVIDISLFEAPCYATTRFVHVGKIVFPANSSNMRRLFNSRPLTIADPQCVRKYGGANVRVRTSGAASNHTVRAIFAFRRSTASSRAIASCVAEFSDSAGRCPRAGRWQASRSPAPPTEQMCVFGFAVLHQIIPRARYCFRQSTASSRAIASCVAGFSGSAGCRGRAPGCRRGQFLDFGAAAGSPPSRRSLASFTVSCAAAFAFSQSKSQPRAARFAGGAAFERGDLGVELREVARPLLERRRGRDQRRHDVAAFAQLGQRLPRLAQAMMDRGQLAVGHREVALPAGIDRDRRRRSGCRSRDRPRTPSARRQTRRAPPVPRPGAHGRLPSSYCQPALPGSAAASRLMMARLASYSLSAPARSPCTRRHVADVLMRDAAGRAASRHCRGRRRRAGWRSRAIARYSFKRADRGRRAPPARSPCARG